MTLAALVLGLVSGLVIGFLAVGLVLIFRSNRFLNLAHAQLGVLSALLLSKLVIDGGMNFWAAFAICVPLSSLLAVAMYQLLIKRLQAASRSTASLLLASIGVSQFLLVFTFVSSFGPSPSKLFERGGYPLPFEGSVEVGGVVLYGDSLLTLVLVPALTGVLALALKLTEWGRNIRAAASNEDAARLAGISVTRVATSVWAVAGAMSAITSILVARSQGAGSSTSGVGGSVSFGPQLLLLALGAAAVGGFRSVSLALAGGIGLGLVQQVTLAETRDAGDAAMVVFLVILGIVLVRGKSLADAFGGTNSMTLDRSPLRVPDVLRDRVLVKHRLTAAAVATIGFGVIVPLLPYFHTEANRFLLVQILVFALVSVSLTVLLGWGGQVSLGHIAIVGTGAFVTAKLAGDDVSLPVVFVLSGLSGALLMVLVGIPALRIRGLTLAVTTLGLAVVAPQWIFRTEAFGGQSFGLLVPDPPSFGAGLGSPDSMLSLYYVGVLVLVLVMIAMHGLRRSRSGRLLIAVRDNEPTAEALGVAPTMVKLSILAVSGTIAGLAGCLYALAYEQVSADQFAASLSLSVLAVPVIGGLGSLGGAVAGAVALYAPAYFLAPHLDFIFGDSGAVTAVLLLLTGLTLPIILLQLPMGLAGAVQHRVQELLDRTAARVEQSEVQRKGSLPLEVEGVSLSFGGVHALRSVSLEVRPGEIVGLIGPNGAGKSTLLNVISGVQAPDEGRVRLFGRDVLRLPASLRAAFGMTRTFQEARLFPGLTVTEAVQVALARTYRSGAIAAMSWAPWHLESERRSLARVQAIVARFGLEPWRDTLTGELSTGTRRICDLALQVAAGQKVLLLDEPTAGVAQREAEKFGPLLRRIRDELDCSIVVVEHDMPLLMALCDRVYALEAGAVIAEGTPDSIRQDPRVVASYLGTHHAAISRSGTRTAPAAAPAVPAAPARKRVPAATPGGSS